MSRSLPGIIMLLLAMSAYAGDDLVQARKPGPKDRCPVCGMFVAKYPDFLSQAALRNGDAVFFDGPKELFKFHLHRDRYLPAPSPLTDADAYLVTDYYERKTIDAKKAWFVLGGDVLGPMGRELVPFGKERDAREFMKDHHGTRVLRFTDVNAAVLKELE